MCVFYKWPETGTSGSHLNFLKDDYAALINCKINFLYTIGKLLLEGLYNDSFSKKVLHVVFWVYARGNRRKTWWYAVLREGKQLTQDA